jgi:HD superfamily phosphohydrolase
MSKSKASSTSSRYIKDSIYGLWLLPQAIADLIRNMIDHPYFDRLRYIKQLGVCYAEFPTATGSRYEHSVGVAYLMNYAFNVLLEKGLGRNYRDEIIEKMRAILVVAGLFHDVGHGPLSHAFERITRVDHEQMSISILRAVLVDVEHDFTDEDIDNICNIITGNPVQMDNVRLSPTFLEQLLNTSFEMDLDKLDYLARDAMSVFGSSIVNLYTFILNTVTYDIVDNQITIRYEEDSRDYIRKLFEDRNWLYKQLYLNPQVKKYENKVVCILLETLPRHFDDEKMSVSDMSVEEYVKWTDTHPVITSAIEAARTHSCDHCADHAYNKIFNIDTIMAKIPIGDHVSWQLPANNDQLPVNNDQLPVNNDKLVDNDHVSCQLPAKEAA